MGWFKSFDLFCRINDLDLYKDGSWDAFKRFEKGLPWAEHQPVQITDDRELTWSEVDALTGGASGTHNTPCPYCGGGSDGYSTRFKITRTLSSAKWHCFYCNTSGKLIGRDDLDGIDVNQQQKAERELRYEQRAASSEQALAIWHNSGPITNNNILVAAYLRARHLELPPNPDAVMRWHSKCPFGYGAKVPCIVSLFRNVLTDKPTGIHRTHIHAPATGGAVRMAKGTMAGSAIKLWPLSGEVLAVGEGIENVLAAVKLGIVGPPAWAATVANNLSRIPVIPGIKQLTIAADNDKEKTGELNARSLRRRWLGAGRNVAIRMPSAVGDDFNDLLRRQT